MPIHPAQHVEASPVSASEAMRRWASASERPRVLLVARWLIGGVRDHLLANYSALYPNGFRFTFVGPAGEALERLRASFAGFEELGFVAAPLENRRCRLWPTVRTLLREGRFGLLHSYGLTAAVYAALANLGLGVPHLVTLHKPLRPNEFPGWLGWLKRRVLRRVLLQADAIITSSEAARMNLFESIPSLRGRAGRIYALTDEMAAERLKELIQALADPNHSDQTSELLAA